MLFDDTIMGVLGVGTLCHCSSINKEQDKNDVTWTEEDHQYALTYKVQTQLKDMQIPYVCRTSYQTWWLNWQCSIET